MSSGELLLTVAGLISVAIVPLLAWLAAGRRGGRAMVLASLAAAAIAACWAAYWVTLASPHHAKHAVLFAALAVVALLGASFSRPAPRVA